MDLLREWVSGRTTEQGRAGAGGMPASVPTFRAYLNNHAEPRCDENEMDARNSDEAIPSWYGEEL